MLGISVFAQYFPFDHTICLCESTIHETQTFLVIRIADLHQTCTFVPRFLRMQSFKVFATDAYPHPPQYSMQTCLAILILQFLIQQQMLSDLQNQRNQVYSLKYIDPRLIGKQFFQQQKMRNRNSTINHSPQTDFHPPCEKDLRVSYLEQYEMNATPKKAHDENWLTYEETKVKTKMCLKDITEKYGFFWDSKGKLLKRTDNFQDFKIKSRSPSPIPHKLKLTPEKTSFEEDKKEPLSDLHPNISWINTCSEIDEKINRITKKYVARSPINNEGNNLLVNYNNIEESKDYEEMIKVPCFGTPKKDYQIQAVPKIRGIQKIERPKENEVSFRKKSATLDVGKIRQKSDRKGKEDENLDEKIQNITKKIKECERKKQDLQIDYKVFEGGKHQSRGSKSPVSRGPSLTKNRQFFTKKIKTQTQEKQIYEETQTNKIQQVFKKQKKNFEDHNKTIQSSHSDSKQKSFLDERMPIIPKEVSVISIPKQKNPSEQRENHDLLSNLCRQIELDEELRNAKIWFENNEDPHKWGILSDKLEREGITMKYRQLVEKFSSCSEEHNPFFSIQESHQNYLTLIKKSREADQFWQKQIKNQYNETDFEQISFSSKEFDVEKKGFIKVEDLVRFINMRTKNFYRTRDLVLVFMRFSGKNKKELHFSQMLRALSKDC